MRLPAVVIASDGRIVHANSAWMHRSGALPASGSLCLCDANGRVVALSGCTEPFDAYADIDGHAGGAVRAPVLVTPFSAGELALVVAASETQLPSPAQPGVAAPLSNAEIAWLLFDQALEPSFTWVPGERRTITSWNTAAERLYGTPRTVAIGQDPRTLLRTHPQNGSMELVDAALARDGQWRGELLQRPDNGHDVLVETVMRLVVLPDGQQVVLETSRDVTLEHRAERDTQRRLRLALSANKTGIWERDFATGETYWSPEAFEVLGVDPAGFELSVEAFGRMLHPADAPRLWAEVDKVLAGADGFECAFRIRRSDGQERWMHNSAIAVRSRDGAPRLIGTVRDITEERRVSAELAESEQKHRQLANAMPQIVWTCKADGTVDWLNTRWFEYTGMQGPLTYDSIAALVHPDDAGEVARRWEEAVSNAAGWEAEYRLRDRVGNYQWHLGRMVPVRGADGRVARLIATATNIEERKRAEQALRDTDRRKDEFLAMLSHELRNPLAPILTAVQLTKLDGRDQGRSELDVIERQAKHMVRLVDDLLDVSKVAQGKIELRVRAVALAEVVAKAVELTAPLIENKRHALHVEVPQLLMMNADADRLVQIIANLLTNAARYTPEGGRISVVARQERTDAVLQVLDNGVGIPGDLLPRIFDMFVQGPRTFDRHEGGLGLGLALVASLTKLHGGTVTAHSAGPGLGSEFVMRLPLRASQPAPDRESQPVIDGALLLRRSILVVDDNEDAAILLARALRANGHLVCIAHDPATALEALATFRPDLAILDIGLPVMDGYQLGRELRQRLGHITLYALSGYAQQKDRDRSREAGFVQHLVKPVDLRLLLRHIANEAVDTP